MPSKNLGDQVVDAKVILEALSEIKRRGKNPVMEELEVTERDLAAYVMEELSLIYRELSETTASSRKIRKLIVHVKVLVLVCILSVRKAQHRLWGEESSPEAQPPPDRPPTQTS
jgi:hypothetical protein